jgi:hypothetical protein
VQPSQARRPDLLCAGGGTSDAASCWQFHLLGHPYIFFMDQQPTSRTQQTLYGICGAERLTAPQNISCNFPTCVGACSMPMPRATCVHAR